ncbi:MAG: PEP-CTERM sorting domain-containing protein [Candidatus Sulfotelmatobacter sp.]
MNVFLRKFLSTAAVIFALSSMQAANAEVIFDNTPSPLPNNIPSLGYQANQTSEFGNEITFAGTSRSLTNVEIIMSDWANQSDYPGVGDANGYDQPLTLNFYNPGSGTSVGSLIATQTETVHVPWNTTPGSGTAFPVNFDFTGVTVPDTVIFGVAYNTETYGANPTGVSGPYISLNYGVAVVAPSVGTDVNPDDEYWNTSRASNYADGGTAGVGIFREDTGWAPDVATIQVTAVPEPNTLVLAVLAVLMVYLARRRSAARCSSVAGTI